MNPLSSLKRSLFGPEDQTTVTTPPSSPRKEFKTDCIDRIADVMKHQFIMPFPTIIENKYGVPRSETSPMPPEILRRNPKPLFGFAKKIQEILERSEHEIEGIKFTRESSHIGEGAHSRIYQISEGLAQLIERYADNSNNYETGILFKCYKNEILISKSKSIEGFFNCSMSQYDDLLQREFPIAKILNRSTAKDDGFYLVENIPHPFEISWDTKITFDLLDEKTKELLEQVKDMFQIAYENNIPLDLSPDNVRVNQKGKVVLIDFMERPEDGDNQFGVLVTKCLKSFACGNKSVYKFLNPQKKALQVKV